MTLKTIKELKFTRLDKLKLTGLCIKASAGIAGGSLILVEGHPYITLVILLLGGIANEIVSYIKEKELLNLEPPNKQEINLN